MDTQQPTQQQPQPQDYAGFCQKFIEDITGSKPQGATAIQAWQNQQNNATKGLNGVAPGDKIYFDANSSNQNDGHVGMYLGNNKMLSATDNGIKVTDLTDWQKSTGQTPVGYVKGSGIPQVVNQKLADAHITMNNQQPTSEPMVKIQNGQTGQTMLVPQSQLSQFGINNGATPSTGPSVSGGNPSTANAQPNGGSNGSGTYPGGITPGTPQQQALQQQTRQSLQSATNLQQQQNIGSTYDTISKAEAPLPLTPQQDLQYHGNIIKQSLQKALGTYGKSSHGGMFEGFLGNLPGGTGGTYQQLKTNLGDLGKDLPNTGDTQEQAQQKIAMLDTKLQTTYGMGIDEPFLKQFNLTRDQTGAIVPVGQAKQGFAEGLGKNAVEDVKGAFQGAGNMLMDGANQVAHGTPYQVAIANEAGKMGKGMVNEYGSLAGVEQKNGPLLDPNKSVFDKGGVNAPTGWSPQEAAQHAYEHPVNTALDLLGAKGLVEGGAKLAGGADATNMAKSGAVANTVQDASKVIPDETASKWASQNFTVPTKRAGVNDLNVPATSKEILAHVQSGMNEADLPNIPDKVTGDSGVITKMTRDAVSNIKGEVDMGSPAKAAQNILDRTVGISKADEAKVINDIQKSQSVSQGQQIGKMNPTEAYDQARYLQQQGAKYMRASTYLTPNPTAESLGKAYFAASNEIMDQVEQAAKGNNAVDAVKTPERLAQLQQISPRLAAQVQNAKTIGDLRSTAKPFVRLSQMQDLTTNSGNSAAAKVAQSFAGVRLGPLTHIGQAVGGFPGRMAGYVGDKILQPVYQNTLEKIMPGTNKTSGALLNGGKAAVRAASYGRFNQQQQQ